MSPKSPPPLSHILETCIYVKDIEVAKNFYTNILNLGEPQVDFERLTSYAIGPTTLLLFPIGRTDEDINLNLDKPDQLIPRQGPVDSLAKTLLESKEPLIRQHWCIAVEKKEDTMAWEKYLVEKGVKIIGRQEWVRGGYSIYFADPDGNVGEIASKGIWPHY